MSNQPIQSKKHFPRVLPLLLALTMLLACLPMQVFAAADITDGTVVRVTSDQAITYPTGNTSNYPNSSYYPLPKGATDTVVGKRIVYKRDGKTHYFYKLACGVRVSTSDVKAVSERAPMDNVVSGLQVSSDERYTSVILETENQVTYRVKNQSDCIRFALQKTVQTPENQTFPEGGLFSRAEWEDGTLALYFANPGDFHGYKASYENGNLVLRFHNRPTSLSGVRVAVDPGHGGKDKGAPGRGGDYNEKDITAALAQYLVEELESRGATALLIESNGNDSQWRKEAAEEWEADYLFSLHCNSAPNLSATGTEVYFFHAFNKSLATAVSQAVSNSLSTVNRGSRYGLYHVALSSQMKSVLVETGFISNAGEFKKLAQAGNQKAVAKAVADALEADLTA